jgi:hypothetical protein
MACFGWQVQNMQESVDRYLTAQWDSRTIPIVAVSMQVPIFIRTPTVRIITGTRETMVGAADEYGGHGRADQLNRHLLP